LLHGSYLINFGDVLEEFFVITWEEGEKGIPVLHMTVLIFAESINV
jgi:hypothetical protein